MILLQAVYLFTSVQHLEKRMPYLAGLSFCQKLNPCGSYHNICLSHSFADDIWSLWFFVRVPFHYNSGTPSLVAKVIVYMEKIQGWSITAELVFIIYMWLYHCT